MKAIGKRGYHANAIENGLEIRLYKREVFVKNQLVPTEKAIKLSSQHIDDLSKGLKAIAAAVEERERSGTAPNVFTPLGRDGLHLSLTLFCDMLLVHLRYFDRSFAGHLYPTKHGVTLHVNEALELANILPEFSNTISAQ